MSQPLQLSAETAIKLSKELNVPLEHLMHMPKHILLQKLAELAKNTGNSRTSTQRMIGTDKGASDS